MSFTAFPNENHEKVQTKTAHGTKNSLAGLAYVPLATWFSAADGTFFNTFQHVSTPLGHCSLMYGLKKKRRIAAELRFPRAKIIP
jgi:hypothetical protein